MTGKFLTNKWRREYEAIRLRAIKMGLVDLLTGLVQENRGDSGRVVNS